LSDTTQAAASGISSANRRWIALTAIGLGRLMLVPDASVMNIALPSAQRDPRMSDGARGRVLTAYAPAFGALLMVGGRIGEHPGHRKAFLIGMIGFAAASAFGGAAPSPRYSARRAGFKERSPPCGTRPVSRCCR